MRNIEKSADSLHVFKRYTNILPKIQCMIEFSMPRAWAFLCCFLPGKPDGENSFDPAEIDRFPWSFLNTWNFTSPHNYKIKYASLYRENLTLSTGSDDRILWHVRLHRLSVVFINPSVNYCYCDRQILCSTFSIKFLSTSTLNDFYENEMNHGVFTTFSSIRKNCHNNSTAADLRGK